MGDTYFCKGRNVLLTNLPKMCLGALYLANARSIQRWCKFSISGAQEMIFCLDSNMYVVYSLRKISTNHICPKAKTISAVQILSGQTVRINPSCYIRTMDHMITANDSEEIEIHSKWLDWTWTLGQLFQQLENEVVTTAIEKLWTKISGKFNPEVLLHELETMAKENTTDHWTFTTPGAKIRGSIVCLFLLFCCWRACCQSGPAPLTSLTYLTPSALPGQPTILKMMVDPIRRWRLLKTWFSFVYSYM
jgi:hypothetical protein